MTLNALFCQRVTAPPTEKWPNQMAEGGKFETRIEALFKFIIRLNTHARSDEEGICSRARVLS